LEKEKNSDKLVLPQRSSNVKTPFFIASQTFAAFLKNYVKFIVQKDDLCKMSQIYNFKIL